MTCGSTDVHDCDHDTCTCFWCRVSRHEHFEPITETTTIAEPEQ